MAPVTAQRQFESAALKKSPVANHALQLLVGERYLTAVLLAGKAQVLWARELPNDLALPADAFWQQVWEANGMLHNAFTDVEVVLLDKNWVPAPQDFFEQGKEQQHLEAQHGMLSVEGYQFANDLLSDLRVHICYGLDTKLKQALTKGYNKFKVRSGITSVIQASNLIHGKLNQPFSMQVFLQPGEAVLCLMRKQGLVLCNRFEVESTEDVVYHVLNVLQTLGVPVKQVGVFTTGYSNILGQVVKALPTQLPNIVGVDRFFPAQQDLNQAGFSLRQLLPAVIKVQ